VYGDQSTIDSPEWVRRVYPPTSTIEKTPKAVNNNQLPTSLRLDGSTSCSRATDGLAVRNPRANENMLRLVNILNIVLICGFIIRFEFRTEKCLCFIYLSITPTADIHLLEKSRIQ
jgi:hypothetical protein